MSIKLKIALYNTVLMGFILIILLFYMESISTKVVESSLRTQLKFIVEENADEVEWDDGILEIDDIIFFDNLIYTLIYDEKGELLAGEMEEWQLFSQPFQHENFTTVKIKGEDYLLYDYHVSSRKYTDLYVRGVVSVTKSSETLHSLVTMTFTALPFFLLCTAIGSYVISKKSMKPLEKIIKIADDITYGSDLSQRIQLDKGNDELHHLSETFDTMFARLEQAFITEKQFTSDVSHELRTPIAVILAECEYSLSGNAVELEKKEGLLLIQRQGKKMQSLISVLLNCIRLENGIEKVELEEVDFSELIEMIVEEQESFLENQGKIITNIPPFAPCKLDYGMMCRIISNLIENSMKYGTENTTVTLTLREEGENYCLVVEDDGIGIEEEHLPHIFQRFYQVDPSRSKESMGLGLAMVEQMVKCHGGSICVESSVGVGTVFTIILKK